MIEGKKVILRIMQNKDFEEFFSLKSDVAQMGEYNNIELQSESSFRKALAEHGLWGEKNGSMVITDKAGRLVGSIGYFRGSPYHSGFELGYEIFRDEDRGKGYMSEALLLFCAYLFAWKPISRLTINTDTRNIPCQKLAERCGFKLEGTIRQALFLNGEHVDLYQYSLLRSECPKLRELL